MKCYNHHDRDAFGICKACGKALCLECMTMTNGVVTCKDECCKNKFSSVKNNFQYFTGLFFALIGAIGIISAIDDFHFFSFFFAFLAFSIGLILVKNR